jgi:recombination protein RecT
MGYQGLIELARRAGTTIRVGTVYENDLIDMECGTEPKLTHKPCIKGERGKVLGFYAIAHPPTGMPLFEYMTREECISHGRKYSKAFNKSDSPWQTAPDSMCLKTVVIRVCKYAPKSILAEWASVETRSGVDLQTISPASALIDDDGLIIDATASEPTGEPVTDLDAIADKFEPQENQEAGSPPWDDTVDPPITDRKMSHFDLMQTLHAARKEVGKTLKELEQIAKDNFNSVVANLNAEQIETMIDILNNNNNA